MASFLYTIGIAAVIALSVLLYKLLNKTYIIEDVRFNKTVEVFKGENIEKYRYLRHSIIITFKDISKFNQEAFLELGIEEYTLEDNVLTFRFTGGTDYNYTLYLKIKERIEGGQK